MRRASSLRNMPLALCPVLCPCDCARSAVRCGHATPLASHRKKLYRPGRRPVVARAGEGEEATRSGQGLRRSSRISRSSPLHGPLRRRTRGPCDWDRLDQRRLAEGVSDPSRASGLVPRRAAESGLHRGRGLPAAGHRQAAGAAFRHSPSADEVAKEERKGEEAEGTAGSSSSARALARTGRSSRRAAAAAA